MIGRSVRGNVLTVSQSAVKLAPPSSRVAEAVEHEQIELATEADLATA